MDSLITGTLAGSGIFRCEQCGQVVTLARDGEPLADCPGCHGRAFERASLFTTSVLPPAGAPPGAQDALIAQGRAQIEEPGDYLVYELDDQVAVVSLNRDATRIGRSLAAHLRFEDPTVSRRHALVLRSGDELRVLDDRSLNGVFVNGTRVESSVVRHGDEIVIGRHRLHFLQVEPGAAVGPPAVVGTSAASS